MIVERPKGLAMTAEGGRVVGHVEEGGKGKDTRVGVHFGGFHAPDRRSLVWRAIEGR